MLECSTVDSPDERCTLFFFVRKVNDPLSNRFGLPDQLGKEIKLIADVPVGSAHGRKVMKLKDRKFISEVHRSRFGRNEGMDVDKVDL